MRKAYQKPCAKRVHFNFEKVVAASGECGSGIVLTHSPGTKCGSKTPDQDYPTVQAASFVPNPEVCDWQSGPNG